LHGIYIQRVTRLIGSRAFGFKYSHQSAKQAQGESRRGSHILAFYLSQVVAPTSHDPAAKFGCGGSSRDANKWTRRTTDQAARREAAKCDDSEPPL